MKPQAGFSREGCAPGAGTARMVQGCPWSSSAPRSFLGAGSLWELFHGRRSHLWRLPGEGGMAPKPPGFLRRGAERSCHGKTPREELWHLPAAPALAVITLGCSTRWVDGMRIPQLLGMSQQGPAALSRGIPPGPAPSGLSQLGICCATTQLPTEVTHGEESL